MTASTQLGHRLVSAPARPLPVPPAPIPPAAPAMPARLAAAPGPRPVPARQVRQAGVAHPLVRFGRVARLAAALAMTLAVVGALGWLAQPGDPGVPQRATVVQVGAGETVWDVAARVAPQSDQRAVVEWIRQLNGMAGAAIQPGQQLRVPDGR